MEAENLKDRTITIEKILYAPVHLVWEAWTQSHHIAKWWGPPGMNVKVESHDFRVGGYWKYLMTMADGRDFISEGIYQEIIMHEKITTSANFKPMTEGVELRILLTDLGENTKFVFQVIHPTAEYCRQQEKMGIYNGWGSVFERLEIALADM